MGKTGSHNFYKGKYFLIFYDFNDETPIYIFDNVRDILRHQNKPLTRDNINRVNVELYRALKSRSHFIRFIDKRLLRVYMIDIEDN